MRFTEVIIGWSHRGGRRKGKRAELPQAGAAKRLLPGVKVHNRGVTMETYQPVKISAEDVRLLSRRQLRADELAPVISLQAPVQPLASYRMSDQQWADLRAALGWQ
nr:hypothetical protein [Chromobacterium amazonense]